MEMNEAGNYRGLHIVIINQINFRIEFAKVFDTFRSSRGLENIIKRDIPKGCIVAAASHDDITTKLSGKVRNWFKRMGSYEIYNLKYHEGFAFISKMAPLFIDRWNTANESRGAKFNKGVSVA